MTWLDGLARRALASRLAHLRLGRIVIADGPTTQAFGTGTPVARLAVLDPRFYRAVALAGHLGAAEAYLNGWWTADDLTALVRVLVRNREALEQLEGGAARLAAPLRWIAHAYNRNTRGGARRNIRAHYDLGNAFFAEFLDETLTYSCAFFEHPGASLREASIAKYDRLIRKLGLNASHHVLEIGTGWGGFALHAAATYGCRVTTTTISDEQYALARERVAANGLTDRITVLNRDYRDLTGRFDRLLSIEMIEAVGHEYYETFFAKCAALLAPGGRMALQAITILDRYYDAARHEVDFIKRYIFPGSNIPAAGPLRDAARRAGLDLQHAEEIGPHYAETLSRWRRNFLERWDHIRAMGFSEEFRRLWEFYFAYCEGGFREGLLNDVQMIFARSAR